MEIKEKQQRIRLVLISAWKWFARHWDKIATAGLIVCLLSGTGWYCIRYMEPNEIGIRKTVVQTAENWLDCRESDGSHLQIVDLYNTYEPSPRDYKVTYEDNWCATFGSAVALKSGLTDIVPMECSCEQQILLFDALGTWQENDCYLPQPGDYIYYVWDEWRRGDCTAWADHVGIVAETFGPVIKVIEGNKDDQVGFRYIFLNDICIRGFGLPNYEAYLKTE